MSLSASQRFSRASWHRGLIWGVQVVITDKAGLVPLIRKNIEANAAQPRCGPAPVFQPCNSSLEAV